MRGRLAMSVILGLALAVLTAGPAPAAITLGGDLTAPERDAGLWETTLTVSDDASSPHRRCVLWRTADGSASGGYSAGSDFFQGNNSVCLDPGVSSRTFTVSIYGDATFEPDESFSVEITISQVFPAPNAGPGPYPVADGRAVITLLNDDREPPPLDLPPPSDGNDQPPPQHSWTEPEDCTIAGMQERYGRGFDHEGQFLGLMRLAARDLADGGITDLLAGRGKLKNVLTCPTGKLVGRVHKLRRGKPLLLAAGKRKLDYSGAGRTSVRLRLTERGRSLLKRRSRVRVRVTVRHVDLQGTAAQRRVKVTLTR